MAQQGVKPHKKPKLVAWNSKNQEGAYMSAASAQKDNHKDAICNKMYQKVRKIKNDLQALAGNPTLQVEYIMELGAGLPGLPAEKRLARYQVAGCPSQTWLLGEVRDGCLWLEGDSQAAVTRGLLALLIAFFSGKPCTEVVQMEEFSAYMAGLHLERWVGAQRRSGFATMVAQVQRWAREESSAGS